MPRSASRWQEGLSERSLESVKTKIIKLVNLHTKLLYCKTEKLNFDETWFKEFWRKKAWQNTSKSAYFCSNFKSAKLFEGTYFAW